MRTVLTGGVAMIGMLVFLGYYAITLNFLPLWIIIMVNAALALADYTLTSREQIAGGGDAGGEGAPG